MTADIAKLKALAADDRLSLTEAILVENAISRIEELEKDHEELRDLFRKDGEDHARTVRDLTERHEQRILEYAGVIAERTVRAETAEKRVAELKEALQPMADVASDIPDYWGDDYQCVTACGHFRRARKALGDQP